MSPDMQAHFAAFDRNQLRAISFYQGCLEGYFDSSTRKIFLQVFGYCRVAVSMSLTGNVRCNLESST